MGEPLNQVTGYVSIGDRAYSARALIMALLEQGISVYETAKGLRVGIKIIEPQLVDESSVSQSCPLASSFEPILKKLEELSAKLSQPTEQQRRTFPGHTIGSQNFVSDLKSSSVSHTHTYSQPSERDRGYSQFFDNKTFLTDKQRCSVCGALIPKKAFFCVKCGTSVRSA